MATGSIFQSVTADLFPLLGTSTNVPNDLSNLLGSVTSATTGVGHGTGALTSKPVPAEALKSGLVGSVTPTFFDDYYNQIWVVPNSLDFGPIGSESSKTFIIWNAYWKSSQTLASVVVENGDGVTLSGRPTPAQFKPLEDVTYTVTVNVDGPAAINTVYSLTFSDGQKIDIAVTGTRAKLWPFSPNWSSSYKISYEFKTEIITSRSGREQRIAHRMKPRKSLAHSVRLIDDDLRRFNSLMWSWQNRGFVMPEVTRKVVSEHGMAALSDNMNVSNPPPVWIAPGVTVILDNKAGVKELRVVDAVDGPKVTFKSITPTPWPAGTVVYYAVSGNFDQSLSTARLTGTKATLNLAFKITPGSEPEFDAGSPGLTIGGREIFDKRPNWSNDVGVTHQHEVDELDYGYGVISRFSPIQFGTMIRQHNYLARNISEAEDILKFFCRNFGQQGEFYAPTWDHDVVPKIPAAGPSVSLRIAGREFYDAYGSSTVNRGLAVRFKDGSMVYRLIQSIDLVSDGEAQDTLITVTQTWGREVSQNTILFISWLLLWRFASDSLTLEFLTDTVAQFQVPLRSLENLPVES